ncbi:hypothetical protein Tco_0228121 [Tanacetum coccineum]
MALLDGTRNSISDTPRSHPRPHGMLKFLSTAELSPSTTPPHRLKIDTQSHVREADQRTGTATKRKLEGRDSSDYRGARIVSIAWVAVSIRVGGCVRTVAKETSISFCMGTNSMTRKNAGKLQSALRPFWRRYINSWRQVSCEKSIIYDGSQNPVMVKKSETGKLKKVLMRNPFKCFLGLIQGGITKSIMAMDDERK